MSAAEAVVGIARHFETLTDPRVKRTRWHDLLDVVVIALCGTICGCDSWEDLPRYGRQKLDWFGKHLRLRGGIPSADTFARVFQRLDPDEFLRCLSSWIESLRTRVSGEIVAIDGQTLRGSGDLKSGGRGPLHLVRAWATENRLVLGQQACEEKSNEITAIPKLLKLLDLSEAIVTIDAMGCQTEIASQIREQQADYVLAVKDNQPKLHQSIRRAFETEQARAVSGHSPRYRLHVTRKTEHGREEERTYYQLAAPQSLKVSGRWRDLRTIGMVIRRRTIQGREQQEVHFYISSLPLGVHRLARAVRSHWSIENRLHWVLDVNFAQDASRIRKGHSPEIASMLRQLALMILQRDTRLSGSLRCKRKQAGWNNDNLETLLTQFQAN